LPPAIRMNRCHDQDCAYLALSQAWFATVQLVLQADWQDVWHSPQARPVAGMRTVPSETVWMWGMDVVLPVIRSTAF
jgi:hypothetical protein